MMMHTSRLWRHQASEKSKGKEIIKIIKKNTTEIIKSTTGMVPWRVIHTLQQKNICARDEHEQVVHKQTHTENIHRQKRGEPHDTHSDGR